MLAISRIFMGKFFVILPEKFKVSKAVALTCF